MHFRYEVSESIFVDGGTLFKKYQCSSCKYLLRDAVQPSCGHWLCQSCAEELFQSTIIASARSPSCPRDDCEERLVIISDDGFNYFFPDVFVRREILGLMVICLNHDKGCDWKGKFADYEKHVAECKHPCEYCGQPFNRQQLKLHHVSCPKHYQLTTYEEASHLLLPKCQAEAVCDYFVSMLKKGEPVYQVNTPEVLKVQHFPQLPKPSPLMNRLQQVQAKPVSGVAQVQAHGGGTPTQPVEKTDCAKFQAMQGELEKKEEEIVSLQATVTKLEKMLLAKNAEIEDRDFRLSLIENSNYDGSMVWKIPQFSQRMADAQSGKYTSIFSLPFYTGRYGYKMCLHLYILGDGIGKNTHMSLFFVIMRGEFDNILPWPFTYRVTFRLMNQTPGGRDIIDTFQPDPMSSSFRKPKNDMNIASGCPRFVSHLELKNGGFIVEDTVFIKCSVDTSTIKHP